ncbi:DgyrCDS3116 [Dimorphilus gyrociliatus]|uniref:DgyrCDS3116 n=1 Tax=Dimorphilus gyrociliatus TaxID=2664684 RepID=A0A7I8VEZ5_9ANNE|nr:DgyrCDS3116 [Dimorphilus gyrociliatus]
MSQPAQLVFLSDYNVGTSTFVQRIINGKVTENSVGRAKVVRHTFNTHFQALDRVVTVQVYDVEGNVYVAYGGDLNAALVSCHRAHAIAVLYDVTNRSSFEYAQYCLDSIVNPRAISLLIANKIERSQRKVSQKEGKLLARIHQSRFIEISAKTGQNVQEAFQILLSTIPPKYLKSEKVTTENAVEFTLKSPRREKDKINKFWKSPKKFQDTSFPF